MITVERLVAVLEADTKEFSAGMDAAEAKSTKTKAFISKAAVGMAVGIVGVGVAAVDMADKVEVASLKSDKVFGDQAKSVQDWAGKQASSLALSKDQALNAADNMALLAQNIGFTQKASVGMSEKMVTLAGNIGAFNNADPSQVLKAMTSAIGGLTRPLKQYGILIDQNMVKQQALDMGLVKNTNTVQLVKDKLTEVNIAQKNYNDVVAKSGKNSVDAQKALIAVHTAQDAYKKSLNAAIPTLNAKQKAEATMALVQKQGAIEAHGAAQQHAKFGFELKVVEANVKNLLASLGMHLLPTVARLVGAIVDASTWMGNHGKVMGIVAAAAGVLGAVLIVTAGYMKVMALQTAFASGEGLIYNATMLVTSAVTKTWAATQWLLNAALSANPIGLLIIGLAALVVGIVIAYKHSATFRNIVQAAFGAVTRAGQIFVNFFAHTLPGAIGSVISWVKGHWPLIVAIMAGPIGLLIYAIRKHWDTIKSDASAVVSFFAKMPGRISNAVGGMFDGLVGAFRSAINAIISKWNSLSFTIPSVDTHIPGVGKVGGMTISTPDIPLMASGGIIKPRLGGTLVRAGEAGRPEAIIPLPSNLKNLGSGGGDTYVISVSPQGSVITERDLGNYLVTTLQKYGRRNGRVALVQPRSSI